MKRNSLKIAAIIFFLAAIVFLQLVILFRQPERVVKPSVPFKGKVAIILDDWGYNQANAAYLEGIKSKLTLSVLPRLPYSAAIARRAQALGHEVILHLPMEPRQNVRLERDTIMAKMSDKQIRAILDADLTAIPYVRGVSNHMGSKATEDPRVMGILFAFLKKRGVYFVDSNVTPRSVCRAAAEKSGIGFAARDVFLDNRAERDYISNQLAQLCNKARVNGYAVGIGHDRPLTLQILKEQIPLLQKQGYVFVRVSELLN